jgi:YD repeat-containing protein
LFGGVTKVDNLGTPNAPRVWLTFSYDAFGNVLKVTDSLVNANVVSYAYDQDNNLTLAQIKLSGAPRVQLSYDLNDRLTTISRDQGAGGTHTNTAISYDNADRVTGITHTNTSTGALATFTYGWDKASQLTSYTGPEGSLTYTYDNSSELTGVGNARSENYSYDLNGNRNMTGWSTGGNNRLTGDGTFTYAYDNEGNLLSKKCPNKSVSHGGRLGSLSGCSDCARPAAAEPDWMPPLTRILESLRAQSPRCRPTSTAVQFVCLTRTKRVRRSSIWSLQARKGG